MEGFNKKKTNGVFDISIALMNGVNDGYSGVKIEVVNDAIYILQSNGKTVMYPMHNVARLVIADHK